MNKRLFSHLIIIALLVCITLPCPQSVSALDPAEERAEQIVSSMSLEDKVAQMMIVSMPAKDAAGIQSRYQFGGYILFARDFAKRSKKSMKKLIASCQNASVNGMLIGVDEEGGTVVRASYYKKFRKTRFRSPRQVYKKGKYKAIVKDTRKKDKFLRSLGINTNFGPVADVTYKKSNFMYKRAFSNKAGSTSKFVSKCVAQMSKDNMISSLKHFPGYGGNGDTHGKIIRDKRSILTFLTRDLRPFSAGISAGADMIMVSHTIVNAFDSERPASLSPAVNSYLRNNMNFGGVTITDGLGMKGVTNYAGSQGRAAVLAVKAGNDMLCATGDYKKCHEALVNAVRSGEIEESQIDTSVKRIILMKIRRGVIR